MTDRENFEAIMRNALSNEGFHLLTSLNESGEYRSAAVRSAWIVWQAATEAAKPQWIKCSERRPDVGDVVLTAIDGCVNIGVSEISVTGTSYFTSIITGRELPATHWMPLPEAPTL